MELPLDHAIPEDMLIKVIACSEPCDRNTLMRVNANFRELTAKTNTKILLHSPLLLGKRDQAFYMLYYCDEGTIDVVHNLLRNGVGANQKFMLNISPIVVALQNKHYKVANLLRSYYPEENPLGVDVLSPIYIAVHKGDVERINYYFDFGLIPMPESLLRIAVVNGDIAMVSLFIKRLEYFKKNTEDALQLAARFGYKHIVELLLPYFSRNEKSADIDSAYLWAAFNGHVDIVQLLINYGAHINASNDFGDTALHVAAYNNHSKVVDLLLAYSVATYVINDKGETALDIACECNNEKIIELLCKHGCVVRANRPESRYKIAIRQLISSPYFSFIGYQAMAGLFSYMIDVYDQYK